MPVLPPPTLDWQRGGLSPRDVDALRASGIDLRCFEARDLVLYRRPRGTQLHLENCSSVAAKRVAMFLCALDLAGANLCPSCFGDRPPVSYATSNWLREARDVALALAELTELEQLGPEGRGPRLGRLLAYRGELEEKLERLCSGQYYPEGGTTEPSFLTDDQAEEVRRRLDALVAVHRRSSEADTIVAAIALGLGSRPPARSLRTCRAPAGPGVGIRLAALWSRYRETLAAGGGLDGAEQAVRHYAQETSAGVGAHGGTPLASDSAHLEAELDGVLAHWRDDLDARAEAGRRLVLIGLWHLPDRRICEILRAGFPCWSTDPGSSLEGKVYVVPEVVAEQLVADRLGVTWFGPAGERPDVLAEVVAGLWRTLDAEEAYLVAQRLIES